jgi:MFS family permease
VQFYFDISTNLAISGFTFYALGVGLGPIIAAPISELYGRRIIYRCSLPLGMLFMVAGAVAQNFQTIAVSRFFTGLAISPTMAVGAGTIQDVWDPKTDMYGALMAVLLVALIFIGAELGPVAGSFVTQDRGWRWSFWLPLILVGTVFLLSLPMKETKKSQILRCRATRLKLPLPEREHDSDGFTGIFSVIVSRSLHMLFTEPIVFLTALHGSYALALFYVYYIAIPYIMLNVYGFTLKQVGLSFLPMVVGSLLAIPVFITIEKTLYQMAKVRSLDNKAPPEARLYGAMFASVLLPISLFW